MALSIPHCFKPALLLGLDIGHAELRMVELSQDAGRRFRLERYARLKLPADVVADRDALHPARLAEHIAALAARLGSKRKRVALALPADAVFTHRMQAPANIGAPALEQMIAAEASGYLSLAPDQVCVDHRLGPGRYDDDAPQRDIVLAAARREQVEDRIAAVEAAGLMPAVLDIDLYAAHAACMEAGGGMTIATPAAVALLICHGAHTQIALFDQHQLHYHRELPGCDRPADPAQIAATAMRTLPIATPAGMTLSHIFVGGDWGTAQLARLSGTLQELTSQAAQSTEPSLSSASPHGVLTCSVVQPFSAMARNLREKHRGDTGDNDHNDDEHDDPAGYLVACGLAMRRISR